MFFRQRSAQAEFFDLPGQTASDTLAAFRDLDRLNRAFPFSHPFVMVLPQWLGAARCERLELTAPSVWLYYGTRIVLQARTRG